MVYVRILWVLLVPVVLIGCVDENRVFKPLYQQNIPPKLSNIYIQTIDEEQGVFVRNLLQSRMRYAHTPKYRLQVSFTIRQKDLAIARDNSIARKQVRSDMTFTLYQLQTADTAFQQLYRFQVFGTANYSSASSPYVIAVSEKDAKRRALTIAAENGILRLASYFMSNEDTSIQNTNIY